MDLHRAIVSLIEELEAIDWYQQRSEACQDDSLREILLHHRDEEIEHAIMNLEWIRRRHERFAEVCRRYLFIEGSILAREEQEEHSPRPPSNSLGIGSLRNTRSPA